jgi:hypothetical protein
MKKRLFSLVITIVMYSPIIRAQKSVSVSTSVATKNYFEYIFLYNLNIFGEPPLYQENLININLTYKTKPDTKLYSAFNLGYESLSASNKYLTGTYTKTNVKSTKLSAELYCRYNSLKQKFSFYGFVGLGAENLEVTYFNNNDVKYERKIMPIFHIAPIAFNFNLYKRFTSCFELGVGYKGLINFGVQYNFK